jgi:hypothetical protein
VCQHLIHDRDSVEFPDIEVSPTAVIGDVQIRVVAGRFRSDKVSYRVESFKMEVKMRKLASRREVVELTTPLPNSVR